jgi:regulator of sigma E protease
MITILAFLFVLGVLIFVHELGHFLVARWYGVRVLRFSLGFDPKLFSFERGGTLYSVGIIPLGGFVKLAGETVEDQRTGAPDEFLSKSKWIRFQVYLAGPVMNLILALILTAGTFLNGVDVPLYESAPAVVGSVEPGKAAEKAGIRVGDQIVRVGERDIASWEQLDQAVIPQANRDLPVVLRRDGAEIQTRITPESVGTFELGSLGVFAAVRPQLRNLTNPNGPAARAGLQRGDVVVALNGAPRPQAEIIATIHKSAGQPLTFTIERAGARHDVVVVPEQTGDIGLIGVEIYPWETRRIEPGVLQAITMSFERNWATTVAIGDTLRGLFARETPMKQLMGPIAIAQLSGSAAQLGWIYLIELMAMLSLNLGLINLLPIPVMDGGQIAILGFEGLTRRNLSIRVKERILMAGAAMVILLMVTVIYNDIMRLLR